MTRKIFIALFLLIFITSVSAFDEDFFASAPQETITICGCGTATNTLSLQNMNPAGEQTTITISNGESEQTTTSVPTPSTYTISQSGSAAKWTTLLPNMLTMQSGEKTTIQNVITAPCSADGTYGLTTKIETSLGTVKEIFQNVNVQECDNIAASVVTQEQTGCPCTTLQYEFTITNSGSFFETYLIGASRNTPITFSENRFLLAPGESRTVYGFFNGECELNGDIDFKVLVKANSNEKIKELPLKAVIEPCYDFEVATGELVRYFENYTTFTEYGGDYQICEKEPASRIPIRIYNTADIGNNYDISLEGPKWAGLSHNYAFDLRKGEYTEFFIELNPWAYLEEDVNLELTVTTEIGNLEKTYTLPLRVSKCHTPELFPGISRIGVNYSIISTLLPITNTGNQETTYDLTVLLDWAEVSPAEITLLPNETTTIELITYPTNATETGKYETSIIAVAAANGVTYSKDLRVTLSTGNWYDSILTGFGGYLIYLIIGLILLILIIILLAIGARRRKKDTDEEKETTRIVEETPVKEEKTITKKAVKKTEKTEKKPTETPIFSEEENKEGFWKWLLLLLLLILIFFGLWYVYANWGDSLTAKFVQNESGNITVEPSLTEPVEPVIEPPVVETNETGEPAKEGEPGMLSSMWRSILGFFSVYLWYILIGILLAIIIIVLLSIGSKKREDTPAKETKPIITERKARTKAVKETKPTITERKARTKAVKETKKEKKKEEKEKKKSLWWVGLSLVLLAIILLLAGFFGYTWYTNHEDVNETMVAEPSVDFSEVDCLKTWPKNTPTEINLSVGFTDPDGDKLEFSSNEPDNVMVDIDDRGIATVTPDHDFVGTVDIMFYADDGKGFRVPTGNLSLCISDEETDPVTKTWDFVNQNRTYLIIGLVILIIIVLLIVFNKEIIEFLEEDDNNKGN